MLRLLLLLLLICPSFAQPSASELAEREAVKAKRNGEAGGVYFAQTPTGQGSVIAIEQASDPEHVYFLTASHVCPANEVLTVHLHGYRYELEKIDSWHGMNLWNSDTGEYTPERLVMLRTKTKVKHKVYYYGLRTKSLKKGDRVYTVGFENGSWRGRTTRLKDIQADHYIADTAVDHGGSGGALLDSDGNVAGIVVSAGRTTTCLNIAQATKNFATGKKVRWCRPAYGVFPVFPWGRPICVPPQRSDRSVTKWDNQGNVIQQTSSTQCPPGGVCPMPIQQPPAEVDPAIVERLVQKYLEENAWKFKGDPGEPGRDGVDGSSDPGLSDTEVYALINQAVAEQLARQETQYFVIDSKNDNKVLSTVTYKGNEPRFFDIRKLRVPSK